MALPIGAPLFDSVCQTLRFNVAGPRLYDDATPVCQLQTRSCATFGDLICMSTAHWPGSWSNDHRLSTDRGRRPGRRTGLPSRTMTRPRRETSRSSRTTPRRRVHDHAEQVYVNEQAIVDELDRWLSSLFRSEHLDQTCDQLAVASAAPDDGETARRELVQRKITDCERRLSRYRTALDSHAELAAVTTWIAEAQGEKLAVQEVLAQTVRQSSTGRDPGPPRGLTDITAALTRADGNVKAQVHTASDSTSPTARTSGKSTSSPLRRPRTYARIGGRTCQPARRNPAHAHRVPRGVVAYRCAVRSRCFLEATLRDFSSSSRLGAAPCDPPPPRRPVAAERFAALLVLRCSTWIELASASYASTPAVTSPGS